MSTSNQLNQQDICPDIYSANICYVGELLDNKRHGQGTSKSSDGDI